MSWLDIAADYDALADSVKSIAAEPNAESD
jgi:hypothetical protein